MIDEAGYLGMAIGRAMRETPPRCAQAGGLAGDLRKSMSDDAFNQNLAEAIDQIYRASVEKT